MGYSDLATGYPGCRHHGIFRTYVYTWRLARVVPPFFTLCAHGGRCVERVKKREVNEEKESKKRERERKRGEKYKRRKKRMERKREKGWCAVEGEREKERKNERERERERSVRTSLRGFSRPATYGNVIRAFRWMLSCVFALLRNHVVLPSRSTLPFSFFGLLLFTVPCLFVFFLQRESMSMRKRFPSRLPPRPRRHQKFVFLRRWRLTLPLFTQ